MKLIGLVMVTSPTGKSVIVMGGWQADRKISKAMFEFNGVDWIPMEQTLQHDHEYPVVIPIPDDLVNEKDTNNEQK